MRFGKIGEMAEKILKKSSSQKELERFTLRLVILVMIFIASIFLFNFFVKKVEIREIFAFSLILGISILPEFFPSISIFTLTVYSKRFAKGDVIIKRISAIEDLGVIDVFCSDKNRNFDY